MNQRKRQFIRLLTLGLWLAALAPVSAQQPDTVKIQFITISDWHGQLDPLSVSGVGNVGGAAALSTYFKQERAANPNTLVMTAGDAFGGSPPLSSFFNEEPAIKCLRLMGLQLDTFGNHSFDRSIAHLQSMINLARDTSRTTPGKPYPFVSANLKNVNANLQGVEPYKLFDFGRVRVGVFGITNPEAPTLVAPGNFGTITTMDPVQTAMQMRDELRAKGADIVVAICHLGLSGFQPGTNAPLGELIDFAKGVTGIDLIFGDHTDVQYSGVINNALVVENRSKGLTYARTVVTVDKNDRVVNKTMNFISPVVSAIKPDSAIVALLDPLRAQLAANFDNTIGVGNALFPRGGTPSVERSGESALGDLIADAFRDRYGVQLALFNGGSIRSSLPSSYLPVNKNLRRPNTGYLPGPAYDLVVGDVYTILPFNNDLVTRTITGAQLHAALENGVSQIQPDGSGTDGRFPQISGFKFTFNYTRPVGSRVVSVTLNNGATIRPDTTKYTFTTIQFVNRGGDSYTMFADGQGTTRELDAFIVRDYLIKLGTVTPTLDGRITKTTTAVKGTALDNPSTFELAQNYPNPFSQIPVFAGNSETVIQFTVPARLAAGTRVQVRVYNTLGEVVRTLVDQAMLPGQHTARWNGRNDQGRPVAAGIYFYRLVAGDFNATRRLLFLK